MLASALILSYHFKKTRSNVISRLLRQFETKEMVKNYLDKDQIRDLMLTRTLKVQRDNFKFN